LEVPREVPFLLQVMGSELSSIFLQLCGAWPHTADICLDVFNIRFQHRVISNRCSDRLAVRTYWSDTNIRDQCFWCLLNGNIYSCRPQRVADL